MGVVSAERMNELIRLRRFFAYTCAFVGAGLFGDFFYGFVSNHVHIPGEFWAIIGAAVAVAALLTYAMPSGSGDGSADSTGNP